MPEDDTAPSDNFASAAWGDWSDFATGPLHMSLGSWFLFIGFLIVTVIVWRTVLAYIIAEV